MHRMQLSHRCFKPLQIFRGEAAADVNVLRYQRHPMQHIADTADDDEFSVGDPR